MKLISSTTWRNSLFLTVVLALVGCGESSLPNAPQEGSDGAGQGAISSNVTLLNVSYDPTREFYQEVNAAFAADYKAKNNVEVTIDQSHGGSGKQARAVIDGLEADVVTLALAYDIDVLAEKAQPPLVPSDWQKRLPNNSSPYTSTIVFLVRKGNPKGIKDWPDLVKGDVQIITPNPKTSGGARWNYLAAWAFVLDKELGGELKKLGDESQKEVVDAAQRKAREFVSDIYRRVPVLDSGARGSTNTFVQRGIGDVLLAWENEALLASAELGPDKFDIVTPSVSILAEPPVTVVDKVADKKGTKAVAEAYLKFLYTKEGQEVIAKNFYRPSNAEVLAANASAFPAVELFPVTKVAASWDDAQKKFFADGAEFDKIYTGEK